MEDLLKSPITLISHGRSGTSLIQNIFDAHPDISVAGETADLIFSTWYSIHQAQGIVPGLMENGKLVPWDERTARAVRGIFGNLFQFKTKYWMQKPISQPFVIGYLRKDGMSLDEWFKLYWQILNEVFPQGKFITVLRHPCDVVVSAKNYWGREQKQIWNNMAVMARCILHPSSEINYAINYNELVIEPEKTIKSLFAHLNIPYNPVVLKALDYVYVPKHGDKWRQEKELFEDKVKKNFSRQDEWNKLDMSIPNPEDLEIITEVWEKFGYALDLPD